MNNSLGRGLVFGIPASVVLWLAIALLATSVFKRYDPGFKHALKGTLIQFIEGRGR